MTSIQSYDRTNIKNYNAPNRLERGTPDERNAWNALNHLFLTLFRFLRAFHGILHSIHISSNNNKVNDIAQLLGCGSLRSTATPHHFMMPTCCLRAW